MSEGNGWEQAKQLITYRLDEIQRTSEGVKASVDVLSTQFAEFKTELAKNVATKEELSVIQNELHELKIEYARDVAQLKLQAGVWGALAGLIPTVVVLVVAAIAWLIA